MSTAFHWSYWKSISIQQSVRHHKMNYNNYSSCYNIAFIHLSMTFNPMISHQTLQTKITS